MKRIGAMMLAAAFGLPAFAQDPPKSKAIPATKILAPGEKADDAKKKDDDKKDGEKKPETRAEKIAAIRKDMSAEQAALMKEYQAEEDKDAKNKIRDKVIGLPATYAGKALAIAEENPKDDDGFQAIQLAMNFGRGDANTKKAMALLVAHHVENPKIADSVVSLGRGASAEMKSFLQAVLARNPENAAKGRAAYALVQILADGIENAKSDSDSAKLEAEAKTMLARIEAEFASIALVTLPPKSKAEPRLLGKLAAKEAISIGNIKNLKVGKPAPEIEGPDMDEKTFKISDYKGKVVMLDFWGHW